MVVAERRLVRWMPNERQFIHMIDQHLDMVASRNQALITEEHMRRVARTAARIAVRMGMPEQTCSQIAEGGLIHDIGKNHPIPAAWLKEHEGLTVSDAEKEVFRRLHTSLGKEMVGQLDTQGMTCSKEDLEQVCLYHHDPCLRLKGRAKILVPIIQTADAFDAMVTLDGGHSYASFEEAEAIRILIASIGAGVFDPGTVDALVHCRGLRVS